MVRFTLAAIILASFVAPAIAAEPEEDARLTAGLYRRTLADCRLVTD